MRPIIVLNSINTPLLNANYLTSEYSGYSWLRFVFMGKERLITAGIEWIDKFISRFQVHIFVYPHPIY